MLGKKTGLSNQTACADIILMQNTALTEGGGVP
jgi:hypothetical protein